MLEKRQRVEKTKIEHSIAYYLRVLVAGTLMGLANLVPGVSGGTMILACGVYEDFVAAVSAFTTLRIRKNHVIFVALIAMSAGGIILVLAGSVKRLVELHRPEMYSLFIGLAWGGVPLVMSHISRWRNKERLCLVAGLALMLAIALIEPTKGQVRSIPYYVLGGVFGSSAMVLPGISGAYVLMIMKLYEPILGAVHSFKEALSARAFSQIPFGIIIPVGIGVVVGIVAFSNAINFLLKRYRNTVTAFLLGLLIGAVFGLLPFSPLMSMASWNMDRPVRNVLGYVVHGGAIATPLQVLGCFGLLALGAVGSYSLSRVKEK